MSSRFYYGWVIVAVVFVTLFLALGLRFAFGIFYVAILDDTGWSRADAAGVFSVAMVAYAVAAVLSGALFDWLGPRRLFPLGAVILGMGLILSAQVESIGGLYLFYGGFVGTGFAFLGFIPHMALLSRWFVRKRGLATAVALAGTGIGAFVITVLSEQLIGWLGWRQVFVWYGILAMALLIPLTWLLHRDEPAAIGLHPDGTAEPPHSVAASVEGSGSLRGVFAQRAFWLLLGGIFLFGVNTSTFAVHQTRLSLDYGFTIGVSAALFGLTGLFRSVGALIWGPLSDRVGRRPCIAAGFLMAAVGVLLLLQARSLPQLGLLATFVVLWGIGFNGTSPVYASMVADTFHGPHLGKTFGLLDLAYGFGSAAGPWVTGYLFDRLGSYEIPLWGIFAMTLGTALLFWLAAKPHRPAG